MRKSSCLVLVFLTSFSAMTFFLAGCNTPAPTAPTNSTAAASASTPQAKRIAEYQVDYAPLPATTQKQLAQGLISRGQNMKLIYIALGHPTRIVTTPDAKTITWTYANYTSPVIATNRIMTGEAPVHIETNGNPLHDTFEAWRNGLLKHEINTDPQLTLATKIVPKAPTQSWSDYGNYRTKLGWAGTPAAKAAINIRAEHEYREAMRVSPVASPDPVKLDIVFIDRLVSDAFVNDSFSAFSDRALPLRVTASPEVQTQLGP